MRLEQRASFRPGWVQGLGGGSDFPLASSLQKMPAPILSSVVYRESGAPDIR
jgi:hypothetical protein